MHAPALSPGFDATRDDRPLAETVVRCQALRSPAAKKAVAMPDW
jgi:hypothetical protein